MAISTQRQGEIALAYLKARIRREGVTIKPGMNRAIANEAKNLGITTEEAGEFAEMLVREVVEEAFAKTK